MQTDLPRLYWLFVGSRETSSSRIHGYRVHEYLCGRGWPSEILFGPLHWIYDPPLVGSDLRNVPIFRPGDVVLFQKVRGDCTRSMLEELRAQGVATVFIDCDYPLKMEEARLASLVVCSSSHLAAEYRRTGVDSAVCVPEAWESTAGPKPWFDRRCVWFGNAAGFDDLDAVRTAIASSGWDLTTISDHPDADVPWNLDTAWETIRGADAAILPVRNEPRLAAKSANRVVQAMALGLVVLASPLPSYREVIRDGRNGFLCTTELDWGAALQCLQQPAARARIANTGYRYARRYFPMERAGAAWEQLLHKLAGESSAPPAPEPERRQGLGELRSLAYNRVAGALVKSSAIERAYRALASQ